jgi:hypothetical protein
MYEIFRENRKRAPWNQIQDLYKGKWVFLVNLEGIELEYDEENDGMVYSAPAELMDASFTIRATGDLFEVEKIFSERG